MSNFMGTECLDLEDMDVKMMYFPFLIAALIALGISAVGVIMKPRHLFWTNFIVMMGLLEHMLIFAQVVGNFSYGTINFAIGAIVLWIIFIAINVTFYCIFRKRVKAKDATY